MCLMAEISARSSVSSLQSLSVHLDPWSLLRLTTLVAPFSSKCGSYAWYCSWSPGTPSSDLDIMLPDKEMQATLNMTVVATSTLKNSASYMSYVAVTIYIHCSIPVSIPPFHSIFQSSD